jgi:3-polyprenyl-4-hydroxybenzoate decarboxylase
LRHAQLLPTAWLVRQEIASPLVEDDEAACVVALCEDDAGAAVCVVAECVTVGVAAGAAVVVVPCAMATPAEINTAAPAATRIRRFI